MNQLLRKNLQITSVIVLSGLLNGHVMAGDVSSKIVGGEPAEAGELPWMTSIGYYNPKEDISHKHLCGATVIDAYWAVTAAHCTLAYLPSSLEHIVLRSDFLQHISPNGTASTVIARYIHPKFDYYTKGYDIALLRLGEPTSTQPISLAPPGTLKFLLPDTLLTTAGWGLTLDPNEGDELPALQKVQVPYVTNKVCNLPRSYDGHVKETEMCAGYSDGGKDACSGDSGGPLVVYDKGVPLQVGIVSWGQGCAQKDKYGVYTDLTHPNINQWIHAIVSKQ